MKLDPVSGKIAVHCAHARMVQVADLRPNPRNPNHHSEAQIALLGRVIAGQGWRSPVVVSSRSGLVVAGHGRLAAAKVLGCAEVPVDYQDFESEAQEWAHMIADNRLAELAEIDLPELKDLLQEIDTGEIDMDLTGFDDDSLKQMMSAIAPSTSPGISLTTKFEVIVECEDEAEQREIFDAMQAEGRKCRVLTL